MSTSQDLLHQILYISYIYRSTSPYLLVCMVGKYRYVSFLDTETTSWELPKSLAQLLKNLNSFPHVASLELFASIQKQVKTISFYDLHM